MNQISSSLYELIKIINESSTIIDDYINIIFIDKNNIKTLIKFDKKKFLLAGWTSSDQYNNQIVFEIEITSVNQMINNNVFTLPSKSQATKSICSFLNILKPLDR